MRLPPRAVRMGMSKNRYYESPWDVTGISKVHWLKGDT